MYDDKDVGTIVGLVLLLILLSLTSIFLGAWIGCRLWGIIAVEIFGLPTLTYWEFFGLIILVRVIFPNRTVVNKKKD